MRNLLKKSLFFLILLGGLLVFTACGGSSGTTNGGDTTEGPTAQEVKGLIQNDIDSVETGISTLETDASSATGEMAASLANDAYALKNRLKTVRDSLENDVNVGYITEEERTDIETSLDELDGKIDPVIDDLKAKAGEFASTIDPDSKASTVESKEDLDTMIADDDNLLTNLESGISSATGETKETFRTLLNQRLENVDSAIDDLDRLESDGTITADEKDSYEKQLRKIRNRCEDLMEQVDDSSAA